MWPEVTSWTDLAVGGAGEGVTGTRRGGGAGKG